MKFTARKFNTSEDAPAKVPTYIVTYSDMVTLLLTFFVMLLSLANMQDPELTDVGRDAFWSSISNFGLGTLFGKRTTPYFGNTKIKYYIDNPDKLQHGRTIDAREEEMRRKFRKVNSAVQTQPSEIVAKKTNFSVTNIRFIPGQANLNKQAKQFLTEFTENLQQNTEAGAIKLYVLGLATDEKTERKRWITSAMRAQAVESFLSTTIPQKLNWPVYSWGAGTGGDWVGKDNPAYKGSHILIAVLRQNE